jgi:arginyl-tRNA synthetase
MNIKQLIALFLTENNKPELISYLEYPLDPMMGDVALPCFILAKELKQSPIQIAQKVVEDLKDFKGELIQEIVATGPYVNFTINWGMLGQELIQEIVQQDKNYG